MSGFCGWIGEPGPGFPVEQTISQMSARLPDYGPVRADMSAAQSGALFMSTSPEAGSWLQQSALTAVIEGYPRWTDPDLAQLAGRDGHAAALAQGFGEYGEQLLQKIQGHFALAVIDVAAQRGLFAIDRLGIGTLSASESVPGVLAFATTTGSVAAFPGTEPTVGAQSIFDYLFFDGRIPAPDSMYTGLTKLAPGQYISFDTGRVQRDSYWQPPAEQDHGKDIDNLAPELVDRMRAAIARNIADQHPGKVGVFLSGGADSSTIVGLLAEVTGQSPKSFTIGFDTDAFDGPDLARIAASQFGADHHKYSVTPDDVFDSIPKIAVMCDEPFAGASAVDAYFGARLAKDEGVDIMLAGNGGDEVFAGKPRYVEDRIIDQYSRVPQHLRRFVLEPFLEAFATEDSFAFMRKARHYTAAANMAAPARLKRTSIYSSVPPAAIFDGAVLEQIDAVRPLDFLDTLFAETPSGSALSRMMNLDRRLTLADSDLRTVNRMGEMAGVRVRYPFLDDDLLAFSAHVPDEILIGNNECRYFYKHAMQGFLPREILENETQGVGLPLAEFARRHKALQDLVYDSLTGLKQRNLFRNEFLDSAIRHHRDNDPVPVTDAVWGLMMLELWYQNHMDRTAMAYRAPVSQRAAAG